MTVSAGDGCVACRASSRVVEVRVVDPDDAVRAAQLTGQCGQAPRTAGSPQEVADVLPRAHVLSGMVISVNVCY